MRDRSLAHLLLENSKLDENKGIHYFQNEKNTKYSSYHELFHNARRILNYLAGKGIKEGQELVLQIDDISSFVEVFWACILGKIIPVPVTASMNDEIRLKLFNIWGLLNEPWMCISKSLLDNLEIFSKKRDYAETYNQIRQRSIPVDSIHDSDKEAEIKEPSGGDIAFIQFSSGSTGDPKGVIMTHRNLLVNVEDIVTGCRADKEEVSVSWMPLTHDMGLIGCHFVCVFSGWNHCLINPTAFVRNPLLWLEKIQEYKATMTASPNFGFRHLLKSFKPERHKNLDLSSVKLIFNGAEPISVSLCNDFLDTFEGFGLKRNVIFTVYGLAEAGLAVSFPVPGEPLAAYKIDRNSMEIGKKVVFLDPQENGASFVSEGKPLNHCSIQITDNANSPLADDVCGNISIKGVNVTSGYYNNETETEKTIDALGWLHTGDIGFIHNGSLVVTGRAKEIIFINGQNYFPHDLERIIHEMDAIQEGKLAVTSINTENNATDEILCFIVHKKGLDDFIALTSSINQWVMSKSGVAIQQFIPVDKIPKTSSGKIQRVQLGDAYRRGEYNSILRQISGIAEKKKPGTNEMPGNEIEKKIVHIVQDVLKIKDDEIGIDDNFFSLGGDSLVMTIMLNKIHEHFNVEISIEDFFNSPTIAGLAKMLEKGKKREFAYIKPIGRKDFYSTSPAQKRIYLAQSVDRKSTSYNITAVWHLEGEVNMTKLSEAAKKLVARHDSLRTSFEILNGNIVQRISDSVMFEIDYIETKKENLESEIDSRVIPFILSKAPLLRVTMMKISENNHIIVADMHHGIADATSGGLMIKEVMQIYSGKELKPLRIQYKDYAEWLSQRMASDEIKKQSDYWLGRMKNGIASLNLITDYERPAKQTFTGDTVETIFDSEIANALSQICRKYNATSYMIFYALVSVLLSKYTGQTDILMGSPVSGRDHADLENVVGMFVNMLLMRSFPSPDKTFLHFLTEVRNDTLQGFKNKECQFDELSTQLHYKRDIRRNPIYDVVFAVMNMNMPDLAIPGVKVRPYEGYKDKTCKTDLRFGITEKEKKIFVNVTYNVDLFKKESIVKMSGHLVEVVKTIIRDIHVKLEDIKLLAIPVAANSGNERSRDIEFDL
jgi:acyl-CoA synthetase (AMP-forming)/AMP-acid ligase II/acyl carrier protein